jgi:DNA-binding transcriptional MerR regulator
LLTLELSHCVLDVLRREGSREGRWPPAGGIGAPDTMWRPSVHRRQLASVTGVPARTIRFTSSGVLPQPARRGRVALYDDRHIERLGLIGELQDRGLRLRAVRHLLRQDSEEARLLSGCLGLGGGLDKPWSDDRPRMVRQDELEEPRNRRRDDRLLVRFGVVERGDGPVSSYRYRARPAG